MTPIEAALESLKLQDTPNITQTAKEYNYDRTTLSRRFRNVTVFREVAIENSKLMTEAQSKTLIKYINRLTDHVFPPTPATVRNLAGHILKSGNLSPIDLARHKVDQGPFYKLYLELLGQNTYNMDEKGFLIGMLKKSRRIYSKATFESGRVKGIAQDGNREWITVLATICADGTTIPHGIIHPSGYRPEEQECFSTASPTGWTNDELGLRWLETVFDRSTKTKAGRAWRLLIVDGHGSHINMPFLEYCISNKIILANYPPHSTHRLQPLDVSLFSPLATYYSQNLDDFLSRSQGISNIAKRNFFEIFWPAYQKAFTEKNILGSFKKTGISPYNPNQAQVNQLNQCYRRKIGNKKRRKRQKPLLQRVISIADGGAVFWSPQKITQARDFLRQKEEDEAAEEARQVNNKFQQQLRREEKEEQAKERKLQRQKDKEERERVAEAKNAQQQITVEAKQAKQKAQKTLRPPQKPKQKMQIVIPPAIELLDNIIEVVEVETVNPTTGRPRRQPRLPQRFQSPDM
ncbi:DDE-domain-containing protein [Patellaria atrata CBS 101060]|uniref:DDE-domain-containing protein n=1 Tax=Patellaria atrata CBS 101060 TaxID=1346257 RepID=A0A9P4S8P8_9PEZI|nr:DDE-domain-containing protein [Patellaria atrata CBS 101060]